MVRVWVTSNQSTILGDRVLQASKVLLSTWLCYRGNCGASLTWAAVFGDGGRIQSYLYLVVVLHWLLVGIMCVFNAILGESIYKNCMHLFILHPQMYW